MVIELFRFNTLHLAINLYPIKAVKTSATGMVNHIPSIPQIIGKIIIPIRTNIIPLRAEIKAESLAFSIAVKYADMTILMPFKK
jgi:hypothetical protein